jgi:peptidoglycan/xylan/chitin deacetylase (PgdA/CDA1 family)
LMPMVVEHKYTPLIFLVADKIGSTNVWDCDTGLRTRSLLTLDQIREMHKLGVEFGSHTLTHPRLMTISDAQLNREVTDSKHQIEDLLGVEVTSFAYPYGDVDRHIRSAVAQAGYKIAFTGKPGLNWWNDQLCQRRVEVNNFTTELNLSFQLRYGYPFRQVLKNAFKVTSRTSCSLPL